LYHHTLSWKPQLNAPECVWAPVKCKRSTAVSRFIPVLRECSALPNLKSLLEKIEFLIAQEKWQELEALDADVRSRVSQAVEQCQPDEQEQLVVDLRLVHEAYQRAVVKMESSQGQSAQELSTVQKSLKAAKSYLDSSKF